MKSGSRSDGGVTIGALPLFPINDLRISTGELVRLGVNPLGVGPGGGFTIWAFTTLVQVLLHGALQVDKDWNVGPTVLRQWR